jgi:hypothetical protein
MSAKCETVGARVRREEFCLLWGCEKYAAKDDCSYCPFIKDVLDMAQEMSMNPPDWRYAAFERRY